MTTLPLGSAAAETFVLPYVVVLHVASGRELYCGGSVSKASSLLDPGTCYAIAASEENARRHARMWRERFLAATET